VIEHLVGDDRSVGDAACFSELGGREVAHAEVRNEVFLSEFRHRRERLLEGDAWMWPVNQQEIDVIDIETVETLADRLDHVVVTEIRPPDLRRQEDIFTVYVRGGDPFAH
jgi:hypothetical protein